MMNQKTKGRSKPSLVYSLPGGAHSLASLGSETEKVIQKYFKKNEERHLFEAYDQEMLKKLAESLDGWKDAEAAKVVEEFAKSVNNAKNIEVSSLFRWVLSHKNDFNAVLDCMSVEPPNEISIIKVLSRAGSQKLVLKN